jgi:hypothetical protein
LRKMGHDGAGPLTDIGYGVTVEADAYVEFN